VEAKLKIIQILDHVVDVHVQDVKQNELVYIQDVPVVLDILVTHAAIHKANLFVLLLLNDK
jgi:hypothetical protein